jgi:hypothetical protein
MGRAVREALAYLQAVAVTCYFVPVVEDAEDAIGLGVVSTLERLIAVEPLSVESWRLLCRVLRHVVNVMEIRCDPRVDLARELHALCLARADAAALVRPGGEP